MDWWNAYIHFRFAEKGRGPDTFDCWGLVKQIYHDQLGIDLPSYTELYESTQNRQQLKNLIFEQKQERWKEITGAPKPFDVALLKMAGVPMHVAVVTKPRHMIHCGKDINTVHEKFDSLRWQNKVMGFFRYE